MPQFPHQSLGILDLLHVLPGFHVAHGQDRVGIGVNSLQDFGARFARLIMHRDVAARFHRLDDEFVLEALHHRIHGDEHHDADGHTRDADQRLPFVRQKISDRDVPAHECRLIESP